MSGEIEAFTARYAAALAAYRSMPDEQGLSDGYELGRAALQQGFGILTIAAVHHRALQQLGAGPLPPDAPDLDSDAAFFAECLSPFEMTFLGYRDANERLLALNDHLTRARAAIDTANRELEDRVRGRTAELERVNDALTREVAQRREIEGRLVHAQKMEAIGHLTGGLAHDFNNLLGVIIGNLDFARALPNGAPETGEVLDDALSAALGGAELIKRLLAFARRQPLAPRLVDVNTHVRDISRLLARTLGEAIRIELAFGTEVWPVMADPAQLETSLTNLATNARDAMPAGGTLTIRTANQTLDQDYVSLHPDLAPGDYAMIEVSDTGTGMQDDVLQRVFEPFFTTKEQGRGTGLGLSMVFGFMKQSGGHINVYSEPGVGTTFRLYLPRSADVATATAGPAAASPRGHERILVVEDNERLRRIAERQLAELGYSVVGVADAEAAITVLENREIDLLFTDIVMPGGTSGHELARLALARWPKLKVVLTSGFPEQRGSPNGELNLHLLSKPYRKDELGRVIRRALDGLA